MNLIQIDYFLATARELNFSAAAKSLFVSQPALSRQIVSLEKELGIKLFYRNSRTVRLTPAGELLQKDLGHVMEQIEEAKRHVMELETQRIIPMRLGCMEGGELDECLPELIDLLKRENPALDVMIRRMRPHETYAALKRDECDLVLTLDFGDTFDRGYRTYTIRQWRGALVYGAASPLAKRESLSIKDFQTQKVIIIQKESARELYRNTIRDLNAIGISNPVLFEVENYPSLITNLELGYGYAVLAETLAESNTKLRSYSRSFKKKERLDNPPENWAVFRGVHEAIIDRETFEKVQGMLSKTKHRPPKSENGEKSIFCDLIRCGDCGSKLWYHTNAKNRDIHFFSCSNYAKDYRGTCPSRHYLRADAIEEVVKLELARMAALLRYDEEAFAELLAQKTNAEMQQERRQMEESLQKAISRNEAVATLYEKVYEDNASGKVTDEWFMQLSHKYEVERMELKEKIADLRTKLDTLAQQSQKKDTFLAAVCKFMEMGTLTAPLLQELIDHIDVYETEGTGKNRTQRIVIYYRFVGYIELPETALRKSDNYKANTRQGVAVEYIPKLA